MVLPQALEYNWEFNRSLEKIGDDARQRAMQQRKLEQDNQEKQLQVLQQINPAVLYPKFEKEVVDQSVVELTSGMTNYIKQNPNTSYIILQNMINQNIGQIARWSAGVKSMKDNIDKTLSLMDSKSPYDKGRVRALSIDKALYNTDESGRKILKGADEFDFDSDIVSQVIADNEDKVIDSFKGQQAMKDAVNDASLYTENIEETVETPNGRMTVFKGKKSSVPFFLEVGDNKLRVKQQKDGYIDEGVFQDFYRNPAIRANINAEAKSNMQKIGVPESPEAFEYFKRAYLTTWLENNKKGLIGKVDKTLYEKPKAPSGSGAAPADQTYINAYQKIDALTSSKKKGFGAPVNELDLETQDVVLKMTKLALGGVSVGQADIYLKKEADGTNAVYTSKAFMDDDGNVVRKANDRIGPLTTTGVNLEANKGGGVKTEKAIVQSGDAKLSIKKSDIPAKAKAAGYSVSEYESLLKQKGVKII